MGLIYSIGLRQTKLFLNISKTIFVIFFNVTTGMPNEIQIDEYCDKKNKTDYTNGHEYWCSGQLLKLYNENPRNRVTPLYKTACNIRY